MSSNISRIITKIQLFKINFPSAANFWSIQNIRLTPSRNDFIIKITLQLSNVEFGGGFEFDDVDHLNFANSHKDDLAHAIMFEKTNYKQIAFSVICSIEH